MLLATIARHERVYVELAPAALVVHVADLAEDGPLSPALVVDAADGPHAACGRGGGGG